MTLNKYKIGNLVTISNEKNTKNRNLEFYGINKEKVFVPTFANTDGLDGSKYKIMTKGRFVFSGMQTGRDMCLRIGLYDYDFDTLISPAYTTFEVDTTKVVPEYFFMLFKSDEMDRYCAFLTDGSIRANLDWEVFCDIDVELPSIEIQQKYVNVYKAMVANQRAYEKGLDDLKLVCDAYIEDLRKKYPCEAIGSYIERHDVRNGPNGTNNVMGISTSKCFREPSSKVNKNELSNYKVCKPRQIGFVQTTHNEKVFTYAFNNTNKDIVISSVNEVFSTNENILYPEYLCMFFNRTEFDRYARFHSWGSARETFTWNDLIDVKIPIPSMEIQKSIANIYKVYIKRKEINEKLKAQIKDLCPILIAGAINEAKKEV